MEHWISYLGVSYLVTGVWRHCGVMVCALTAGSSGPGSSPGLGHCVVFLDKTLTLTVPLSTQVYKWMDTSKFNAGAG